MADVKETRKPWTGPLLGLLSPFFGFLALNRGVYAFAYIIIQLVGIATPFVLAHFEILHADPQSMLAFVLWPIHLIGTALCFLIASRRRSDEPLKWYAGWPSLAFFFIAPPIILLATVVIFRVYFYEPFSIQASSMMPALNIGDYVYVNKYTYNHRDPERGDVVVFWLPSQHVDYIKRIIGLPGDVVELKGSEVLINGTPLSRADIKVISSEQYYQEFIETLPEGKQVRIRQSVPPMNFSGTYSVPADEYFVLGDNRDNSEDSRLFGFVPRKDIKGKARLIFWNSETKKISDTPVE